MKVLLCAKVQAPTSVLDTCGLNKVVMDKCVAYCLAHDLLVSSDC